jgi:hypothetical protein
MCIQHLLPRAKRNTLLSMQREGLQDMLAKMEAWSAENQGRVNDVVRSARSILASNDPATVPATTAIHTMQARCEHLVAMPRCLGRLP